MSEPLVWSTPGTGRIVFGSGAAAASGSVASTIGRRALLCTDANMVQAGIIDRVAASLEASGLDLQVESGGQPDLEVGMVGDIAARARTFDPHVVIGVGGGSNMDLAKLVALELQHPGPLDRWYGESKVPAAVRPVIAIPTTAGTGSEVSPVAVVFDRKRGQKVGISSTHLVPSFAILDPGLTVTCPARVTADAGLDALSHAIEAMLARDHTERPGWTLDRLFTGKNPLSDALAAEAIELIARHLPAAYNDGTDLVARGGMLKASLLAGLAFSTAGTGVAHALQYPIGHMTKTSHGLGVALLLPAVMQSVAEVRASDIVRIGRLIELGSGTSTPEEPAQAISQVARFVASLDVPDGLSHIGLTERDIPRVASAALEARRLVDNSPRTMNEDALRSILESALTGLDPVHRSDDRGART